MTDFHQLTDEEWRQRLTPQQYAVLREQATEPPYSGSLLHNDKSGEYVCAACHQPLFSSGTKFHSQSMGGWPSFYDVITKGAVELKDDNSLGMKRTEVVCANCGSHLGHLFFDAPEQPTGAHYCINSAALQFQAGEQPKTSK